MQARTASAVRSSTSVTRRNAARSASSGPRPKAPRRTSGACAEKVSGVYSRDGLCSTAAHTDCFFKQRDGLKYHIFALRRNRMSRAFLLIEFI